MLGESPDVEQLFVAAGFNSIGIQSAGGVGQVMAQWLEARRPPYDLWEVDVRRFQTLQNADEYLLARTSESLGLLYAMHWPFYQHESARGQLKSPMHEEIAGVGACFGELAGWERANWYAKPDSTPTYHYTYGKPDWFENARAECTAVRSDVALFDQTSFAKYAITGVDACAFLNRLSTANLDVPVGRVVYCQWLNPNAGIEADVTVTRIDDRTYWVISAAASRVRDLHWMRRHLHPFRATVTDITLDYAVIGIMGPNARNHLQAVTDASLAAANFAFSTSQPINVAGVDVRAKRITYVGALGWELYIPWADADTVYKALTYRPIAHAGYHAMDSLRLEKGYRHWGHDITEEDTPIEAGLGFTVDWKKPDGFIGRDFLHQQKAHGVNKRLALFRLLDPNALLTHDEPVWQNGRIVGSIRSAAYSFTYNCTLATGYLSAAGSPLTRKAVEAGQYQVEIADRMVDATASLRGWYDPQNLEIHG
jgi:4-methylaminobutanoate oxidase (formaldehyde-forming)